MDPVLLEHIPFDPDLDALMRALRVSEGSSSVQELEHVVAEAVAVARPKALYRIGFIEERGDAHVVVDGVTLTSRVLQVNLADTHRVFAYVATAGCELDEWSQVMTDLLKSYWADTIKEMAMRTALQALDDHVQERYRPGPMSRMNPGSLPDWPIGQQRPLFHLLGDPQAAIGVRLTESLLMIPVKSVSGIMFPQEVDFASCQLCPRPVCPSRRATYDATLYARRYSQQPAP